MNDRAFRHVSGPLCLVAMAGLAISVLSVPPGSYVSEAGVPGAAEASLYRASLVAIGLAAAALATSMFRTFSLAAAALFVAAPAIIGSAAVSCTPGCPLPPHEATTARDLVHAAASVIGVGFCALAMLALARAAEGPLRRLSWAAVIAAWPVLLVTAASMLVLGRGLATGLLERVGIVLCLAWIVAVSLAPAGWHEAARRSLRLAKIGAADA